MRIDKEDAILVVVDVQERLFPHIHQNETLASKVDVLIQGVQELEVPVIVTEQYTKGLGSTIPNVKGVLSTYEPLEKMTFSCCGLPEFNLKLEESYKKFVILCGIETHVCVLQTAVDLINSGHVPVVIADAVSSRNSEDKKVAIERLRQEGAIISTVESILFELCQVSGTDQFKAISKLVK